MSPLSEVVMEVMTLEGMPRICRPAGRGRDERLPAEAESVAGCSESRLSSDEGAAAGAALTVALELGRELFAATGTAGRQHFAASNGGFAGAETMAPFADQSAWLKCALHRDYPTSKFL